MTQSSSMRIQRRLTGAALAVLISASAASVQAQPTSNSDNQEPWRTPTDSAPKVKPRATSSLDATQVGPQNEHQSRALAAAVFARPAAAQRAADKASATNASKIPPADPKPEWLNDQGVRVGGEGLQVSKPF